MSHILRYSFLQMIRSRWAFIYTGFYLLATITLLFLSNDTSKVLVSMTNITLGVTPLIGILFGTTYYYNSKDFLILLMSQPISRSRIVGAMYGGLAFALCISILIGIGIPLMAYGILSDPGVGIFWLLLGMGCTLSIIFSLLAFTVAMRFEDKVKGLSVSIFLWLLFAIIYDGVVLLLILLFKDYPLDKFTIGVLVLNPIDLARILIMMKLDVAAMMGYTGAVLSKFIGSQWGLVLIITSLMAWMAVPGFVLQRLTNRKDF